MTSRTSVFGLYIIIAVAYVSWRIYFTLNWHTFLAPIMLFADITLILNCVLFLYTARRLKNPKDKPSLQNITTDILIPTYDEPIDIVLMTTKAALRVENVNKVFVLDDGNRKSLKEAIQKTGAVYLARTTNEFAKAGNLNFGLAHSDADFVVTLDCDHVPLPNFINELSGHFMNPKLAFVQTPQVFYNLDSVQHRPTKHHPHWNEQTMFYESIQFAKNAMNAAFFCGSGAMLRREALDSVSGFATETATEDIHTAIRLHSKGWDSLYVPKKLAFGLAATDMEEYQKQRIRWAAGSLGLLFRSKDSPFRIPNLTIQQRLSYFHSMIAYMMGIYKLMYILMPICTIFFIKANPSVPLEEYFVIHLMFVGFSYVVTMYFSNFTFHFPFTEQYDIFNILPHLHGLKGVFRIEKKFGVSQKIKMQKNDTTMLIFLSALLGMSIIATVYGIIHMNEGSTILISLAWNNLNAFFLSTCIGFLVYRYAKKSPSYIKHNAAIHIYDGTEISRSFLTGMTLQSAQVQTDVRISPEKKFIHVMLPGYERKIKANINAVTQRKNSRSNKNIGAASYLMDLSWDVAEDENATEVLSQYFMENVVAVHFSRHRANAQSLKVSLAQRNNLGYN